MFTRAGVPSGVNSVSGTRGASYANKNHPRDNPRQKPHLKNAHQPGSHTYAAAPTAKH